MAKGKNFPPNYKEDAFRIWYNAGKPSASVFMTLLPETEDGRKPGKDTLFVWIREEWKPIAQELDNQIAEEWQTKKIAEKIEMLERHSGVAKEAQEFALRWIRDPENYDEMTAGTAVRLLFDAIKLEQEVSGVPDALRKMLQASDEDIEEELKELLGDGAIIDIDANN